MSALARYFREGGSRVSGYDRARTPLSEALEAEGMHIHYHEDVGLLDPLAECVVYTPAIPADHMELSWYREHGYPVLKRSEVLAQVVEGSFAVCVAGTHGKTTISTLTAHLLRHSGYGCNAFLGGISVNYGTNFWGDERRLSVVEADEYDRSFLRLDPDVAVITAMDPDHLDIYGTARAMEDAFVEFAGRVRAGGLLLCHFGLARLADLASPRRLTYGLNTAADVHATGLRVVEGSYRFDVVHAGRFMPGFDMHVGGTYNVENALAAIAVGVELGLDPDSLRAGVATFAGVRRRFEYVLRTPAHIVVDDYAHHPEELRALITGARALYPDKRCTVVFQPHLFSRTRDLAAEFAASLDLADQAVLLPIYPARERPIPGVSAELILDKMRNPLRAMLSKDGMLEWVAAQRPEFLILAGAGDIDELAEPVRKILTS